MEEKMGYVKENCVPDETEYLLNEEKKIWKQKFSKSEPKTEQNILLTLEPGDYIRIEYYGSKGTLPFYKYHNGELYIGNKNKIYIFKVNGSKPICKNFRGVKLIGFTKQGRYSEL